MTAAPKPSGTVVVLRDAEPGLEVLLLQRASRDGGAGPWVFPGGKVEPADRDAVRRILRAAAFTYVAGSLASLLNLARWLAFLRRA